MARGSTSSASGWMPRSSSTGRTAACRKLRDVRAGDRIVCGLGGLRVTPEFRDRERSDFAFMSNEVSSERRVEASVERIARMMEATKARGLRIAFVAGPVVVHTGGAPYFTALIRGGFVDVLLAGNALAVHDVEAALFGTSLGVDLEAGTPSTAATSITCAPSTPSTAPAGSAPAVERGVLTSGVMVECVRAGVDYVLAGSIRDDGPIADTVTDIIEAQNRYAAALEGIGMVHRAVDDAAWHRRRQHAAGLGAGDLRGHQPRGRHEAGRSRIVPDDRSGDRRRVVPPPAGGPARARVAGRPA